MMYTVKQLSKLAGITVRTLHYYDEIGLLKPKMVGENGYRYYDDPALLRLQQILFYRELDFSLKQIKAVLDRPNFDLITALQTHRQAIEAKAERLQTLLKTIDDTIIHLVGDVEMKDKNQIFAGFSDEKQKEYEEEARQRYGAERVDQSIKLWNSYSDKQKEQVKAEGHQIYVDMADAMAAGHASATVQAIVVRWHQHLRYFYEPSLELLGGLGHAYANDPDFRTTFAAIDPELPDFLSQAIAVYVDRLETEWLEREMAGE